MIKKLQNRIAFTLAGILMLIMLGLQLFFYISNYYYYAEYQKQLMEQIADGYINVDAGGNRSESIEGTREDYMADDWYLPIWVFQAGEDGGLTVTQKSSGVMQDDEKVLGTAQKILNLDKSEGIYKRNWYLHKDNVLVMMNDADTIIYYEQQAAIILISGVVGFAVIIICSLLIARWLVKPAARAFEQQKQFISDASHELKTPLAVIGANAQRLKGEIGGNKWLDYILEENVRMGKLLKELLTLAKVENTSLPEAKEKVNLSRIVTGALLPFESIAFEKEIEFWIDIQEDVFIKGEEEHLKQAVIILLDNAFAHVSEHGEIRAKLGKKGKWASVSISNTGLEIPKEEQKKIFQRFYRIDKGRNRAENRYGLGLPIASGIAGRHKGRIEVSSENGQTVFTIFLPVYR